MDPPTYDVLWKKDESLAFESSVPKFTLTLVSVDYISARVVFGFF